MQKILVIDDDPDILDLVRFNLDKAGFQCTILSTGERVLESVRRLGPDLIVLDIMLPGLSGIEVLKQLKNESDTRVVPVIMLTARGEELDRVLGFELGADDYVSKPFSVRELILRVRSILNRTRGEVAPDRLLHCSGILLDPSRYQVKVRDEPVRLTTTEFNLLAYLLQNKGRVITRDQLLESVWGYRYTGGTRTVDTHIQRLREKLGNEGECIHTIRGVGYRLERAND